MSDVYNRIELENGRVLIDITDATATANDVISGSKFHDATGNLVDGTAALKDDADEIFVTGIAYDSTTEKKFVGSVDSTKTDVGDIVRSTTKIATPGNIVSNSDNNYISSGNIITGRTCYTSTNGTPIVGSGKARVINSSDVGHKRLESTATSYTYNFTSSEINKIKTSKYCTLVVSSNAYDGIWGMKSESTQSGGLNRLFIKNNGEIPVGTYNMSCYTYLSYGDLADATKMTITVQITSTQMIITRTGTMKNPDAPPYVYLFAHNLNIRSY